MGKGDQRSRRGKIHRGTFGRRRPKATKNKAAGNASTEATAAAPTPAKEAKVVKKQPKE